MITGMRTPVPADQSSSETRREFLTKLATASLFWGHTAGLFAATDPRPHISFPKRPRDRIAVASYPFRAYIESPTNHDRDPKLPGLDLKDFGSEVVKKFDIHNIEPHSRHFRSLDSVYLTSFHETTRKANVKVVNIAVDGQDSFYDADPAIREKAIAYAKKFVDVAVQVGSPSVRVHISGAKNSKPDVQRTAESLRKAVVYAAAKDVVMNLENDDLVSEDAFFIVKAIEEVNHPFLHALPDFANSMMSGNPDFNYRALTAMFQRAYNICHVKDGEADDQGKYLFIDMQKSFNILKSSGYRGYCSMEYDAPHDPYAPTRQLIEQTIRYLS
jgi:sugar phosphate isomerase/epimerase